MKAKINWVVLSILVGSFVWPGTPVGAQGQPNVSVVNLNVQPGSNGGEMVLTPRGMLVPLPGAGVNSKVVQIYIGSNGGYWYTDRNGQTVDLTGYVQRMRSQAGQVQQAPPPQYAPYAAPQQNSGAKTAAAAGVGAMVGGMTAGLINSAYYNSVPYGTPMYYGPNGRAYYEDHDGKQVFVNDDGDVKWNNVYAANNIHDYRQEQKVNQFNTVRQENAASQAQAAPPPQQQQQMAQQYNREQSERFQQQQNWYQQQSKDNERARSWREQSSGENPFVRGGDSGRAAATEAGGGDNRRQRRFGRGGDNGPGDAGRDFGADRSGTARGGRGLGGRRGR